MSFWPRFTLPAPLAAGPREILLGSLGAGLGLLLTEWVGRLILGHSLPWFVAPMGASAVLLFCVPASPLAQPWPCLAGNTLSAVIGVACHQLLGDTGMALALAGLLAIGTMFLLRCLHPPGGAMALTAVLGGPAVHELGYGFALAPVMVDTVAMLLLAALFNNLAGRRYPHQSAARPHPHATRDPVPSERVGFNAADLDAALASFGEVLDIDREDLEEIMVRAQMHARRRHWGGCAAATSCRATWWRSDRRRRSARPGRYWRTTGSRRCRWWMRATGWSASSRCATSSSPPARPASRRRRCAAGGPWARR